MDTPRVRDARDVEEVVRAAIASEQPLEIIGHGTRRAIGHPMATNAVLDVSALNTRRPRGPSPPSNRAPSAARIVNKWVKPGPATASPSLMTTSPNCSWGPPR